MSLRGSATITAENLPEEDPELVALRAENAALKERLATLMTQVAWLRKQLFGAGKGEKVDRAQLEMKFGELQALLEQSSDAEARLVQYERRKNAREKRPVPAEVFAHLPVHETLEILPEEVRAEPEAYERIGEEKTFEVDVTPPKLFKREIVRPKFRRTDARLIRALRERDVVFAYRSLPLNRPHVGTRPNCYVATARRGRTKTTPHG